MSPYICGQLSKFVQTENHASLILCPKINHAFKCSRNNISNYIRCLTLYPKSFLGSGLCDCLCTLQY